MITHVAFDAGSPSAMAAVVIANELFEQALGACAHLLVAGSCRRE
jgi:hypothetical protein